MKRMRALKAMLKEEQVKMADYQSKALLPTITIKRYIIMGLFRSLTIKTLR
jgi:hypothetical protein